MNINKLINLAIKAFNEAEEAHKIAERAMTICVTYPYISKEIAINKVNEANVLTIEAHALHDAAISAIYNIENADYSNIGAVEAAIAAAENTAVNAKKAASYAYTKAITAHNLNHSFDIENYRNKLILECYR